MRKGAGKGVCVYKTTIRRRRGPILHEKQFFSTHAYKVKLVAPPAGANLGRMLEVSRLMRLKLIRFVCLGLGRHRLKIRHQRALGSGLSRGRRAQPARAGLGRELCARRLCVEE